MFGVGQVHINAEGKSAKEIKEEAMAQFEKQVDEMLDARKVAEESLKEDEKIDRKPSRMTMTVKEDKKMTGYGVETDVDVRGLSYKEMMIMLTAGVAQLFHQLFDDDTEAMLAIAQFGSALLYEYQSGDEDGE